MPRPCKRRNVCARPAVRLFKPAGCPVSADACLELALDELEAIRLSDLAGLHQDEAAQTMGVSRATLGRILASARVKVATALVQGLALQIGGGPVDIAGEGCRCGHCHAGRYEPHREQGASDVRESSR